MKPRSHKGKLAIEYIKEWGDLPVKTLAKKLYKEHPLAFNDVEDARYRIRYYKGKTGKLKSITKELHTMKGEEAIKNCIPNPYEIPQSDSEDWPPFVLPKGNNKILVLSDIHIPYHNVEAICLAVDTGKKRGINTVVLNGDIMDMYQASSFDRDLKKRDLAGELEMTREFLGWITHELPAKYYFKLGNHEERWERYLRLKAPELLDIKEFKLDVLLQFGKFGITLIDDMRIIQAGDLNIMHGHEFRNGSYSPVNPAKGYMNKAKENILAGHNHQTSTHMEKNLNGKVSAAWSTGCLSELNPRYMPINSWNLGFACVEVETDGSFEVDNYTIINGKVR